MRPAGFVRADGAQLLDGAGRPLLLRGIGLGNWLLPEGYMWRFGDDLSSPRQIEAHVERLVGPQRAAEFWARFRAVFVTEADVAEIAALGFDHVRLPLNSRVLMDDDGEFLPEGFAHVDRLLDWCERHELRVLLDLHGAPGGQTGTNIDDSPNGKPELFMHQRYRRMTVELWTEIARRYRDRTVVLGYDLLNEPLPNEWQHVYAASLVELYRELTTAIRAVDPDHLLVYEGSHWATNWSIFTEVLDPNSALQFHRYWCPPDRSSIQPYLDARYRLGLPIYMGEGGENTPEWIYTAHRLYEQHGIGWNFWPWKKLDTRTSPVSAVRPDGWELIADPASDVDSATAWRVLLRFLDAVALPACERRPDVVNAMFGRAPLRVPGWGYIDQRARFRDRFGEFDTASVWHHTSGEPYGAGETAPISVPAGEELHFPLERRPAGWRVDSDGSFEVRWNGDRIVARATTAARLRAIELSGD
ncbi:cellulase family glycosylhydrolase [Dactylosporangium sp. AC04546]|uniref:glycoside hydrolase family 5 protein n=1 Tax=Dactylosporangium sp. AC04546 TaxID=2862460 RepID=UPI001EDD0594|nr:cellulase family glycosylhydrolase [Dactylosporangium sp. AC04546]WVK81409.1 cellulase family glycosylhydrolase [Dactylosporangium sp. AC04546]